MSKDKVADRYDRVMSSAPVNADAARTLSSRGVHEPTTFIPDHMEHYDAPIPTKPPPAGKEHRIGKKYGTITVIGYVRNNKRGSQWLVRCVCGQYEVRGGKVVEKASPADTCQRCRQIRYFQRTARRQAYFDRHGTWPDDDKQGC